MLQSAMHARRREPVFCDLDETLIYAAESGSRCRNAGVTAQRVMDYDVYLRPEAAEILRLCRAGGREVYLFTHSSFGFAVGVAQALGLGFDERTVFSFAMILNCRKALCPTAALIENKGAADPDTRMKMEALGISAERVWVVPSFEPPRFAPARLFVLGLPHRLARLDAGGRV